MHGFGAHFAEALVDPDLGTVHVSRMVGVFGAGRILKGVGELGLCGAAAAIANAVFNATGKRIRELPITPDKLS